MRKSPSNKLDINSFLGKRFGRLVIISEEPPIDKGNWNVIRIVKCICDCGNTKNIRLYMFTSNRPTLSCGCLQRETIGQVAKSHGEANKTPEYRTHRGILSRCYNKKAEKWPIYGGRGIEVCERWRCESGYSNFLNDMGRRPSNRHSIDRIDVNGNYEPSNCRWATEKEQGNNRRNNIKYLFNGELKSISEISEESGVKYGTIYHRLFSGNYSIEESVKMVDNRFKAYHKL